MVMILAAAAAVARTGGMARIENDNCKSFCGDIDFSPALLFATAANVGVGGGDSDDHSTDSWRNNQTETKLLNAFVCSSFGNNWIRP